MTKYILLAISIIISITTSAQKYEKFKWEGQTFYKIFYSNGTVGLSTDNKKNVICSKDRNYTQIKRSNVVKTFVVSKDGFMGIIDMKGNEIIKPDKFQYIADRIKYDSYSHTAYYYYEVGNGGSLYNPERKGIYSVTGKEIIPCLYKSIELDYVKYEYNEKDYAGFYFEMKTPQNHIVLSDTLDETLFHSDKYDQVHIKMKNKASSSDFKDNIMGYRVVKDDKFGFCDNKGNEIIAPIYEYVDCNETFGYPIYTIEQNGMYGVIKNGSVLIEPIYDNIYLKNEDFCFFYVKTNGKEGVLSENGSVLIKPIYDNICYHSDKYEFNNHFSTERNGKHGWCDCNGKIIFEPVFNNLIIYSSGKYKTKINGKFVELNPADYAYHASKEPKEQATVAVQSSTDTSPLTYSTASSFAPNSSHSHSVSASSSNTNSKYATLNDPNLVDNSEQITSANQLINKLEYKKQHCYLCHGKGTYPGGPCYTCRGTGTIKLGYYTPQYYTCNWCKGTGRQNVPCMECKQTNMKISITQSLLKTLQETHGMTKEVLKTYTEIKAKEHNQNVEYQRAINKIADPYLNNTKKSNSSHSSSSDSPKCSICNGTGVDPHPWEDASSNVGQGLPWCYTNYAGKECPYCKKYTWHQHHKCPKCNVR